MVSSLVESKFKVMKLYVYERTGILSNTNKVSTKSPYRVRYNFATNKASTLQPCSCRVPSLLRRAHSGVHTYVCFSLLIHINSFAQRCNSRLDATLQARQQLRLQDRRRAMYVQ